MTLKPEQNEELQHMVATGSATVVLTPDSTAENPLPKYSSVAPQSLHRWAQDEAGLDAAALERHAEMLVKRGKGGDKK